MVLQRIQTLYLFIALILMAVFSLLPAIEFYDPSLAGLQSYGVIKNSKGLMPSIDPLLLTLISSIVVLTLITIFQYKRTKLQLKLCSFLICIALCIIATIAVVGITQKDIVTVSFTYYNILPIIALLLYILAYRGISHDIKLLADSYRIR